MTSVSTPAELSATGVAGTRPLLDRLVLGYSAVWIVFLIGGFRMPWEAIPIDEEVTYSLRRQIVFTLGALLGLHRLVQRGHLARRVGLHLSWVAMAAFICLSIVWTTDYLLTLKRSLVHLFGLLFLLGTIDTHERPVHFFLRAAVLALGACAWISLVQELIYPPECWSIPWRQGLCGLSSHPNVLGPCMQMGILLSLGIRPESLREKVGLRFLQAGLAIVLWRTDSMTSITATMFGIGLFFLLHARSYRAGMTLIAIWFAVAVAMMVGLDELRDSFFHATGRDETLSGRDQLWSVVLEHAREHPVLGTGFGAFWYDGRGLELVHTWHPRQAHHAWIDVIAELGYVGLFAFIAFVPLRLLPWWQRCAGRRGTARRDAVAAIMVSTIALLWLASMSESFFLRMDKMQWILTAWGLMLLDNRGPNRIEREFGP